jgi:glycosyltransferase involved in cell wall biosynthesis
MARPTISVVIPAYNASGFLAETLRSVLAQTVPPDEVLVIDDGSKDNTLEIAESFAPQVTAIRRPNSGAATSRNYAVEQAKSEWIAFVDADDIWEPEKLERQLAVIAQHPETELCYTGRRLLLKESSEGEWKLGAVIDVAPAEKIAMALHRNVTFLPSSVLIRRSTYLKFGGFDTTVRFVEDWELWLRLLHGGVKFGACREPLVQYRLHPNSTTQNVMGNLEEAKSIYRKYVSPRLHWSQRAIEEARYVSRAEEEAAFVLRSQKDPRHLRLMLRSILMDPLHTPKRYKVAAHMMYTRIAGKG